MTRNSNEDETIGDNYMPRLSHLNNIDPDNCPSPELLLDFQENKLSGKAKRSIEDHIIQCPLCIKALEALSNTGEKALPADWPVIEKKIDERFYSGLENIPVVQRSNVPADNGKTVRMFIRGLWNSISETIFQPKRLVYAGALASLTVLTIYTYAYLSRERYFSLSRIEPEQQMQMRSGGSASAFTEGLSYFEQNKYDLAISKFNSYLHTDPGHYASFYYLGLSHLCGSEVKLLGFGYKYDRTEIEEGIKNLLRALQLSKDNQYYQIDCYWYLGKAYLMKEDIEQARQQFTNIIQLNGHYPSREQEAQEMIRNLE